ncbi:MAG: hypothetical protein WCE98_03770, partial [Chlorobium sp.]
LRSLSDDQDNISNYADSEKRITKYFGVNAKYHPDNEKIFESPFSKSLKAFRALYAIDYPTEQGDFCDLLISIAGFSLEPIMHTVLTLRPKNLLFVFSKESSLVGKKDVNAFDRLQALITCHGEGYQPKIDQEILEVADAPYVFSVVRDAITKADSPARVAIDVTGGKKSMDASAFLAASLFEEVAIYYVDYASYNTDKGFPVWGSEFLNKLENPYKVFGVREEQLIKEFWDKADFPAVVKFIKLCTDEEKEETAKKYGLTAKFEQLKVVKKAAECYTEWRIFDYQKASLDIFEGYDKHHSNVLEELTRCSTLETDQNINTPQSAQLALALAIDRYMRGVDAYKHKKQNIAILCYAQSVERLLRFCCKKDWNKLNQKGICKDKIMLGRLTEILFVHNPSYFNTPDFGERLYRNVNEARNAIAHYDCVSSNEDSDIKSDAECMRKIVDELFLMFAKKHGLAERLIDEYKQSLPFCSLNENLELYKP